MRGGRPASSRQLVEADADHSRRKLEQSHLLAVALGPQIGGDRFRAVRSWAATAVEPDAKRRREAFFRFAARNIACKGFAINNRGQYAIFAVELLEGGDLLVDPTRCSSVRRA